MSVGAIVAISPLQLPADLSVQKETSATADFSRVLGNGVVDLNKDLDKADSMLRSLAAGQAVPLHEVMITMEKAHLELQFAVEVRNRLVAGYQELMRMQL